MPIDTAVQSTLGLKNLSQEFLQADLQNTHAKRTQVLANYQQ